MGATVQPAGGLVPVLHHIYSSFGGYSSFRTSDGLSDALSARLDTIVAPITSAASAESTRSLFPIEDHIAVTSTLIMGVDHAGRPRGLSHTILVPRVVAEEHGGVLPYGIPASRFVGRETSIESAMQDALPTDEVFPALSLQALRAAAQEPVANALLAAMLARHGSTAVAGPLVKTMACIGSLVALLPVARRCGLALLAGATYVKEATSQVVVVDSFDEALREADINHVDARTGGIDGMLPRGLALYALSSFLDEGEIRAAERLEDTYGYWTGRKGADPPRAFVRAFALIKRYLLPDASLDLDDKAWPAVAAAVPAALAGGAPELAKAVLVEGVHRAAKRRQVAEIRLILKSLRKAISGIGLTRDQREVLADQVALLVRELLSPPEPISSWADQPVDAVRGLAHEAEQLLAFLMDEQAWT